MRTTFEQRLDGLEAKLLQMGQMVQSQLDRTLEALAAFDLTLADEVVVRDDQLDQSYVEVFRQTEKIDVDYEGAIEWASRMILVARYLERIGDHSVDIGEQVFFIVTGEVRTLVPPKAVRAGLER